MNSKEFRRHLHRNPELSFKEFDTQRFILDALRAEGIECRAIATTGVIAKIEGIRGNLSRAVVLRADIDALPVKELNDIDFKSVREGVMHACGHDIHAAVLFGVLQQLNRERNFEGTLFGIFQPGEELNPGGAVKVLAEEPFEGYTVAAVIGEHVDSHLEIGEVGICPGRFMAANDELRLYVTGRGGHAARRAEINDTVTAMINSVKGAFGGKYEGLNFDSLMEDQITLIRIINENGFKFPSDIGAPAEYPDLSFFGLFDMGQTPALFNWPLLIPILTFVLAYLSMKLTRKLNPAPTAQTADAAASNKIMEIYYANSNIKDADLEELKDCVSGQESTVQIIVMSCRVIADTKQRPASFVYPVLMPTPPNSVSILFLFFQ